jgi:hypothetical protein
VNRKTAKFFLASLVFSGASHLLAQEPSLYLKIIREDIKSGKPAAHEKTEMAFARAFSKTKYPNYVAWEAITGPSQAWFLERYDSYAAMEAASKISNTEPLKTTLDQLDEQDGALRTGERNIILRYAKDLSYTPVPANLAKNRYYWVAIWRIRPGHTTEFAENRKLWNGAAEKIGAKMRRVVYISANGGLTYYSLSGMESLKAMDEAGGVVAALSAPDRERYYKLMQDAVSSEDSMLFEVNPKMSNPPKEYISADPDFWAPKPKPAK